MPKIQEKIAKRGTIEVACHYPRESFNETELLEVQIFEVQPAEITVGWSMTYNLEKYESAKTEVRVTLPAYVEELDAAYEKAYEMVGKRGGELGRDIATYKKNLGR